MEMELEWKEAYARKNEYFIFEEEPVKEVFQKVINKINNYLSHSDVQKAEIKDSHIEFPDCKITFEIDKKQIQFRKESNDSFREALIIIDHNNFFRFVQIEETSFYCDEEFIDLVFKYLLMN